MTRPRPRTLEAVHLAALGVWLGALLMTGAGAAVIFPALRDLDPALPAFAASPGPHWQIAGGHIGQRMFFAGDLIQVACVFLVLATGVPLMLGHGAGRLGALRALLMIVLLGVMTTRLGVLGPAMARQLADYWEAARAGDREAAASARAAFDARHPLATGLLGASAALVAALMIASMVSIARTRPPEAP